MTTAIYPGTFDPITNGHLDVLARACRLFDKVIVAVASDNFSKKVTFGVDDRVRLIQENVSDLPQVLVESFLRFACRLRLQNRSISHYSGTPCGIGLRVRVSNGSDESSSGLGVGNHFLDAEREVFLHQLEPHKASSPSWWSGHQWLGAPQCSCVSS